MPSYRDLLQVVEVAVSGAELQSEERAQLEIALRQHQQTFRDLLNYPVGKDNHVVTGFCSNVWALMCREKFWPCASGKWRQR